MGGWHRAEAQAKGTQAESRGREEAGRRTYYAADENSEKVPSGPDNGRAVEKDHGESGRRCRGAQEGSSKGAQGTRAQKGRAGRHQKVLLQRETMTMYKYLKNWQSAYMRRKCYGPK